MLPPSYPEFRCNSTSLTEAEEMDSLGRPGAIVDEVFHDFRKKIESWGWVGSLDHLPKIIEGWIPLI